MEILKLENLCEIKTGKKDVNQGNPEGKYPFFTCALEYKTQILFPDLWH